MEFASITITAWFNGRFVDDGTDGDDDDEDGGDADEDGFEQEEEESTLDHTISLERSSHKRRRWVREGGWVRARDGRVRGIRPLDREAEGTSEPPLATETPSHCSEARSR